MREGTDSGSAPWGRNRAEPPPVVRGVITVYSTAWCGYCHRLAKQLDRAGVEYAYVDIEQDPQATELVMQVNGGNRTVPTVVFADGSALTNPSVADVLSRLPG